MAKELQRHNSRMRQGATWWEWRNREDKLPTDIADDPGKMIDVNYFLKFENATKEDVEKFVATTIGIDNNSINKLAMVFELSPVVEKPKKKGKQ